MHKAALMIVALVGASALSGCMGGAAGVVASQAAASAVTGGVARNQHLNRFRGMDCAAINEEMARSRTAITNPLVGDGGYTAAMRQVAAEKGC